MSADEFDPFIERQFSRTPAMADAELFAADIDARLESGGRVRTLALALAGLIGGVVAVRETMNVNLNLSNNDGPVAGEFVGRGIESMTANAQGLAQAGLDHVGLSGMAFGSLGAMQLFWITAGALIAIAAAGVMKLSQEV
ncbi:hypothetical protein [Brevundimonas sp.]|uniref:hypothetical protein n=1 Tax=Brevundimonas sp. TaxID=1871086 RepID=UPI002ABAD5DA|nr:hypothetical protein [Brevundimonas sp.]MDZ4362371.1 hypothetical protein [Brevundimonas sp.]